MARRRTKHAAPQKRPPAAVEERSAEAATVAWMLAAVATLASQLVALAARIAAWGTEPQELSQAASILPGWFLLCAVLTGLVCLALTPVVYRLRKRRPPLPVTIGAVVISLTPLVVLLVLSLLA